MSATSATFKVSRDQSDHLMTPEPPRRLGRGLDALLAKRSPSPATGATEATSDQHTAGQGRPSTPNIDAEGTTGAGSLREIPLTRIRPNPYQPRKHFQPEELADLKASLQASGLLQPITVRPVPGGFYELIAGERRLRAATGLGWTQIPALVRQVDNKTLLTLALIENLQRADLDPIEEADGYQRLSDEFELTHQEVAEFVGKDRSTVANSLRLLQLPASVKRMLQEKQLTAGHARALLSLPNERAIIDLAREVAGRQLSVREVERRVSASRTIPSTIGRKPKRDLSNSTASSTASDAVIRQIEAKLMRKLQTRVSVALTAKDKGEVRIAFLSSDDLERVLVLLGVLLD